MMTASVMTVNFLRVEDIRQHKSGKIQDKLPTREAPRTGDGKVLTPKQIRARARRRMKRADIMSDQEIEYLYQKPIAEWDLEELSRGRPRNNRGTFSGPAPKWINAAVHEEAMERYTAAVKSDLNATTVDALQVLKHLINNNDFDDKGKPVVPASTKLDAAKFLIEHVVGKPKQRIEADVSVKLQGILGQVMVNPAQALMDPSMGGQGYTMGHFPGVTMPMATIEQAMEDGEEDNG
jgi:hypothetical protein